MNQAGRMFVSCAFLLVAGCSSTGGANGDMEGFLLPARGSIKIESEPPGAAVYVLDKQVGITPLMISQNEIFPLTYPKEKESLYGKITLKKTGCKDFIQPVSQKIVSVGLHAQLDCMNSAPSSTSGDAPISKGTVEQRLEEIKDLLNKGLITEDEAKKAREHVLNEL